MDKDYTQKYFSEKLSLHIKKIIPKELAKKLVEHYEKNSSKEDIEEIRAEIISSCEKEIFQKDIVRLINGYLGSEYFMLHKEFNVVDSSIDTSTISYWHFDYGIKKTLRLFIYLNSVSEHGGNTLLIDKERSKKLAQTDAITYERTNDTKDIKPYLKELGLDTEYLAYDFDSGDGLLLNPMQLVHRCLAPTKEESKRYTVCFMFIPSDNII